MSSDYTLAYGTHVTAADGRCAMEWVSHLAGEPHGDAPSCVSPVVRAICMALNDRLPDEPRQRLRPYLTRTIGTAGDGLDRWRAWLAMDWLTRTYAPTWLELAQLRAPAARLRALAPLADAGSLRSAVAALEAAAAIARAGRAAELGVPGPVSWLSFAAAASTARAAAWECAGAAAWAAARLEIGELAGDRARAAARSAGGDAAAIAAGRLRLRGGRPAVREAVRAAIAPTTESLTRSAFELLDRMLTTEQVELPPARALAATPARGLAATPA
jgi:hypothetical protein